MCWDRFGIAGAILGKRLRKEDHLGPAAKFSMAYFGLDEVALDRNKNGVIVGMRPNGTLADSSNMLGRMPAGPILFQSQPLTKTGSD